MCSDEYESWKKVLKEILPSKHEKLNNLRAEGNTGELHKEVMKEEVAARKAFGEYNKIKHANGVKKEGKDPAIVAILNALESQERTKVWNYFETGNIDKIQPIVDKLGIGFQDKFYLWKKANQQIIKAVENGSNPVEKPTMSTPPQQNVPKKIYTKKGDWAIIPGESVDLLRGEHFHFVKSMNAIYDCHLETYGKQGQPHLPGRYRVLADSPQVILAVNKECLTRLKSSQYHSRELPPSAKAALLIMSEEERVRLQRLHQCCLNGSMVLGWNIGNVEQFINELRAQYAAPPPPFGVAPPCPPPFAGNQGIPLPPYPPPPAPKHPEQLNHVPWSPPTEIPPQQFNNHKSGKAKVQFDSKVSYNPNKPKVPTDNVSFLQNVATRYPKEMNILFLGESGIGKSTFINAFVNYVKHGTLRNAENDGVEVAIDTSFCIRTEDGDLQIRRESTLVKDNNEVTETGKSATLTSRSYVFPYKVKGEERMIRIIDTPGILDTEGLEKDRQNYANILSHIARYHHLDAICFLMGSRNSRLGAAFTYVLDELLGHLHIDATNNIFFCITNTSPSAIFGPGDTLGNLKTRAAELEKHGIRLNLGKDAIYCVENESYRYLCARKMCNLNDRREAMEIIWNDTAKEIFRMLDTIAGRKKPHRVEDTLSLNDARNAVENLIRPLADITISLAKNKERVAKHKQELEKAKREGKNLQHLLYTPQVIPKVMRWGGHIRTEYQQINVVDPKVQRKITAIDEDVEWFYEQITMLNTKLNEEESLEVKIRQMASEFSFFLKKNAIVPYSDAYLNILEYYIREEQQNGGSSCQLLQEQKILYEQKRELYETSVARGSSSVLSTKEVAVRLKELRSMERYKEYLSDFLKINLLVESETKGPERVISMEDSWFQKTLNGEMW